MWERWDSNPLHGHLTRAGQVVQATVAPLAFLSARHGKDGDKFLFPPSSFLAQRFRHKYLLFLLVAKLTLISRAERCTANSSGR